MKKWMFAISTLLAAMLILGCDDDSSENDKQEQQNQGDSQDQQGDSQDQQGDSQDQQGDSQDQQGDADKCVDDAKRCNEDVVQVCKDGSWTDDDVCSEHVGDGPSGCFTIDNVSQCRVTCPKGNIEGTNENTCWETGANYNVAKLTCAKDDAGKLYLSDTEIIEECAENCENAVCVTNEKTTEACSKEGAWRCSEFVVQKCVDSFWTNFKDCYALEGIQNCYIADDRAQCKEVCPFDEEGDYNKVCSETDASVVNLTCHRDANGALYVSDSVVVEKCASGQCKDGQCLAEGSCKIGDKRCTGEVLEVCKDGAWQTEYDCSAQEAVMGSIGCYVIDSSAECRTKCFEGDNVGVNDAVCYSLDAGGLIYKSTCAEDDNKNLYMSDIEIVAKCENGCTGTTCNE